MASPQAPQPAKKKLSTGMLILLIMGALCLLGVPVIAITAAVAIPNLLRSRMAANESAAISACKTFAVSEDIFKRSDQVYATSLQELGAKGLVSPRMAAADAALPTAVPQAGYLFKVLTAQGSNAPGGAKSYLKDGKMVAGYALLAYPMRYDTSGRNCFLIGMSGTVYQKDLGPDTDQLVKSITAYDPSGWITAE